MGDQSQANNKRIAKNTLLLYFRMILLMGISFYTSRVVLKALGVDDYGVYNVIGGFVVMFSVLSSSLTSAISRFITVEIGKDNKERLKCVFSTSLRVQVVMSLLVAILIEIVGIWFLYNKMKIPDGREDAAFWVLQCSIVVFIVGLINVPYNSVIVAHEKMSAFAYISILEAVLKLLVVFALFVSMYDKLIVYAFLLMFIQVLLRLIYGIYCHSHFEECKGKTSFDKGLFKEMWNFAGWNLLSNGAYMLNTQGVNMLMNVFFGVVANAARGIANQVNNAVQQFVSNFMMAMTPQITKLYVSGEKDEAFKLACRGTRFSFFLMYFISLPVMLETDQILSFWLDDVPLQTKEFVIWTILGSLVTIFGQTLITLQMAEGNIKRFQIVITCCGFLPFPLTYIVYESGAPVLATFLIYFIVYYFLIFIRLYLVHQSTGIPYSLYFKDVIFKVHLVSIIAFLPPFFIVDKFEPTLLRLFITVFISIVSSFLSIMYIGLQKSERNRLFYIVKSKLH